MGTTDFLPWKPVLGIKRVKISNYILFIAGFGQISLFMQRVKEKQRVKRPNHPESPNLKTPPKNKKC